jgi:hypothetical protein
MKQLDEETLLVGEYPEGVSDGPQIEENLEYIRNNVRNPYGHPFKIVRIPMPPDQFNRYPDAGGYYRTYTNSLIVNKTVIVPTYEEEYDTTALRIYREAMPGYNVVGIECNAIIPLLGAIHCITKEIGVKDPVWIDHAPLYYNVVGSSGYHIGAKIKAFGGVSGASLYWTTDTTGGFQQAAMTPAGTDSFEVFLPAQPLGTKVFYYFSASSNTGRTTIKPPTAPYKLYYFIAGASVPVELVSFSASTEKGGITLNWETASELNNKGFEIQRATEKEFQSGIWYSIGYVEGAGTTTEQSVYSFKDKSTTEKRYYYRLCQHDFDGRYEFSDYISVSVNPTDFLLHQNYPNPFNPSTIITFSLPVESDVILMIYTINGETVLQQKFSALAAGTHTYGWNGTDMAGIPVSGGIYFCRLRAAGKEGSVFEQSIKMMLLK